MDIKNGVIKDTFLGLVMNSLTFRLIIDLGGGGSVSFGDCSTSFVRENVDQVLRKLGVSKWEDLKGTPVRVQMDGDKIKAIGHYLRDTGWLLKEGD